MAMINLESKVTKDLVEGISIMADAITKYDPDFSEHAIFEKVTKYCKEQQVGSLRLIYESLKLKISCIPFDQLSTYENWEKIQKIIGYKN